MPESSDTSDDLGRVLVIVPTYNERESLPQITARIRANDPSAHILIADDNSPDGTGAIADSLAAADDQIHVMHRASKAGLGAAYIAGFTWGLERDFDVLVEMDADGSHQPEQLHRLLDALADADLVLGSRWIAGGGTQNWSKGREVLSKGGNTYARVMLGIPLHDATGGYRAFRAHTLRGIDLASVSSQGYCFQVDLAWRAVQRGFAVKEVPITFVERAAGTSKMSSTIVVEALWRVTEWGLQSRVNGIRRFLRGGDGS
ncbi:MAG: polyprenol monophosphomannose synthase [Actinomycetales bacterium]|nr:polyprenol monophosphomannose synthase [Actinomycetales bacterium]